jgi:hypothetical protein
MACLLGRVPGDGREANEGCNRPSAYYRPDVWMALCMSFLSSTQHHERSVSDRVEEEEH